MDIGGLIGGFGDVFKGISLIQNGADTAVAGANFNSELYKMAANSSIEAAQYNQKIVKLNLNRSMDALSREITTVFKKNQAVWSSTGFSFGSKSFLANRNATLSGLERNVAQQRSSAKQRMDEIMFEGQSAQVEFLNRANAEKFRGELAQNQADNASAKAFGGAISKAFSSFVG